MLLHKITTESQQNANNTIFDSFLRHCVSVECSNFDLS